MFQGIISQSDAGHGFKIVELCHLKEGSTNCYAFIAISPEKYLDYKDASRCGSDILIEGTEVLFKAEGNSPSLSVLQDIRNKFGIRKELSDPIVRMAMSEMNPRKCSGESQVSGTG